MPTRVSDAAIERPAEPQPASPAADKPSSAPLALPLAFSLLLAALGFLPQVAAWPVVRWSFFVTSGVLIAWDALMFVLVRSHARTLRIEVSLRPQHYVQACAHLSILAYWGWYWREVYHAAPLIAAQLTFAYAFDALLAWSRRDTYTFGFGPFPIIFSTNLFLWFKPEWFYLQFVLVAVGFAAKELIRWTRDGRRVHIFNPSSFPLAVASLALLLTGMTRISWGPEIATTQYNPPHIYALIFLVALPGQFLFGVASMTLAAVTTVYAFALTYFLATGNHFFLELPFPIAIFLASHLLFTDPSTSPRTELGRLVFGVLYASGVIGIYVLFDRLGLPTFYDKLLPVPLLNLSIRAIDRAARSEVLKRFDPALLGRALHPRQRNLAYMTIWIVVFLAIQAQTGAEATLARADTLKDQGRMSEAIDRYREFTAADPNHFEGQRKLGAALLETGQREAALPALERAVELRPRDAAARYSLAYDLMQLRKFEPAEKEFQQALALDPGYATATYGLGLTQWAGGKHAEALQTFRDAVRRWPADAEAHYNFGAVLEQNGQIDDAAASYVRAVQLKPTYAEANFALALIYERTGEYRSAIDRLRRALSAKPDLLAAETQLAWLLATTPGLAQTDRATALALAEDAAGKMTSEDATSLDVLAAAQAANGQYEQAARTAARALAALGNGADARALTAVRERLSLYQSSKPYVALLNSK